MPSFRYTARDADGREQSGLQSADSGGDAARLLRARGWVVIDLQPESVPGAGPDGAGEAPPDDFYPPRWSPFRYMPPAKFDIEFGLRQLAAMLRSGITLLSALRTAADQARRPRAATLWEDVRRRIEEGSSLADALERHSHRFPALVVQLVRAGEQSGTLDEVLERAAEQLERQRTLKATLLSALMYPAIVIVLAVAVAGFMVLKVIPILQKFLVGRGKRLPGVTQALIDVSDWLQKYIVHLGIGIVFFLIVVVLLRKYPPSRLWMDKLLLRLPLVGTLLRIAGTAMFARGLGMLLENGIGLVDGLKTTAGLMGNAALRRRVELTREAVLAGGTLARPLLSGRREFLPMLGKMTAVGEETGTLGQVLAEVARFHETQLAAWVRRLSTLIEPVVTIVVGGIVGFVYIAFFMALYGSLSGAR